MEGRYDLAFAELNNRISCCSPENIRYLPAIGNICLAPDGKMLTVVEKQIVFFFS